MRPRLTVSLTSGRWHALKLARADWAPESVRHAEVILEPSPRPLSGVPKRACEHEQA